VALRTSLSGIDAAFLSLETPNTPMNVIATFLLDPAGSGDGIACERVIRRLEERLVRLAPFRRRLAAVPFGLDHPIWIEDPDLCVRDHVHRVTAPAPGSERALADLVARIAALPLDRARPLWELWVAEGLSDERVALIFKLHHALADGVSAAELLLRLFDPSPLASAGGGSDLEAQPEPAPTSGALLVHALARLPQRSARLARLLRDSAGSVVAGLTRSTGGGPPDGSRMPMPFSAPRMPWNAATSPRRSAAFGSARLADLKLVGAAFGASVNHVVLAASTQSLRNYLEAHGGAPDVPLVAAVPVSLRSPDERETCGNRISAFLVHLPVHLADPLEQLLAVRDGSVSARQLHTQLGVGALGEWAEFASAKLLGGGARLYSGLRLAGRHRPLHNLVISNVRGPATRLYLDGAAVCAVYPLGPVMDGAGMNITVVSYVESVAFGIIACERSVPHVTDIALGFGAAVADLRKLALETPESGSSATGALNDDEWARLP
jgi:diacylglycerol O-acyltransferase / wax synthase